MFWIHEFHGLNEIVHGNKHTGDKGDFIDRIVVSGELE